MRRRTLAIVGAAAAFAASAVPAIQPPDAQAFKVDFNETLNISRLAAHLGDPIHEDMTEIAILVESTPGEQQLNRNMRRGIRRGVQNTDVTHQWDAEYHFDNSSVALGVGFAEGFAAIARHLEAARSNADGNEQFFRPFFKSFREIAGDVQATFARLAVSPKCLSRSTCPTAQFVARDVALATITTALVFNANPDPHTPTNTGSPFAPNRTGPCAVVALCSLAGGIGPYYKRTVDTLEEQVRWALGPHKGKTLAETLGRTHDLVERLERARDAIRAYRAFEDLGHAFHATQDFFAHTNYVELMAGVEVGQPIPAGTSVPIPDDYSKFSLEGLSAVMGGERFAKLESGAVYTVWLGEGDHCHGGPVPNVFNPASEISIPLPVTFAAGGIRGGGPRLVLLPTGADPAPKPGFNHCHYTTAAQIGLNKDEPGTAELSYANHEVAKDAAKRVSQLLWRSFLTSIRQEERCPQGGASCPAPSLWAGEWDVEAQQSTENETYNDLGIITFFRVVDKPTTKRNEVQSALNLILFTDDSAELAFCFAEGKVPEVYTGFYKYTGGGTVVGCTDDKGNLHGQYINTGGPTSGGYGYFSMSLVSQKPKRFQGTYGPPSTDLFFYNIPNLGWRGQAVKS